MTNTYTINIKDINKPGITIASMLKYSSSLFFFYAKIYMFHMTGIKLHI